MKLIFDTLTAIADRHLGIPTLAERKSDSLDYHDVSVWGVKDALFAAYQAGARAGSVTPAAPGEAHTPEPWTPSDTGLGVWSANEPLGRNKIIANCDACARPARENRANCRRIIAAVNACAGTPTRELEAGIHQDLRALADRVVLAKDTEESVPVELYNASIRLVERCQS